jgi:hypothetical protein
MAASCPRRASLHLCLDDPSTTAQAVSSSPSPSHCSPGPGSARSCWPPGSAQEVPIWIPATPALARWPAAPRPGPSRSGPDRCRGQPLPIVRIGLLDPGPQLGHPCSRPRSAGRPRLLPPESGEHQARERGEAGSSRRRDRLRLRDQRSGRARDTRPSPSAVSPQKTTQDRKRDADEPARCAVIPADRLNLNDARERSWGHPRARSWLATGVGGRSAPACAVRVRSRGNQPETGLALDRRAGPPTCPDVAILRLPERPGFPVTLRRRER